ncbi:MAG: hypothetical protein ACUVTX_11975 [Bacteroidales bacterium]
MFPKLFIVTSIIVVAALITMGIRMLLNKGGNFPEFHVGRNREMKKRGIKCAQSTDTGCSPSSENVCAACEKFSV